MNERSPNFRGQLVYNGRKLPRPYPPNEDIAVLADLASNEARKIVSALDGISSSARMGTGNAFHNAEIIAGIVAAKREMHERLKTLVAEMADAGMVARPSDGGA